jgi:hypothetical protein
MPYTMRTLPLHHKEIAKEDLPVPLDGVEWIFRLVIEFVLKLTTGVHLICIAMTAP